MLIFTIYFVFAVFFWALGFVFGLIWGGYLGLSLALFILFAIHVLGDRFLLGLFKAESAKADEFEVVVVKNVSCRLGMERVDVYYSNEFNNIYAFCGLGGRGRVVIGRRLIERCSQEEIRVLLFSAVLRIKSKEIRYIQTISLLAALFSLPRYVLNICAGARSTKLLQVVFQFYELPILSFKRFLIKNDSALLKHDDEVVRLAGSRQAYASALFKIMHSLDICTYQCSYFSELAVVVSAENNNGPSSLIVNTSVLERYERLR